MYRNLRHNSESEADFKYIAKVPVGRGRYRYFYDKESYQAYLAGRKKTEETTVSSPSDKQAITSAKNTDRAITNKIDTAYSSDNQNVGESFVEKLADIKVDPKDVKKFAERAATFLTQGVIGLAVSELLKGDEPDEAVNSFDDMDKKTKETTHEQDQEYTNPNYKTYEYAYTQNCTYCTAVYDLRRRGYDVEAMGIERSESVTAPEIISWYDGITMDDMQDLGDVAERAGLDPEEPIYAEEAAVLIENDILEQYEEGARGHFLLYWANGQGGHDVIWEVQNGEVILRDCQNNETVKIIDYLQYANAVQWFRSDNLKPNDNILKTVKNRKD